MSKSKRIRTSISLFPLIFSLIILVFAGTFLFVYGFIVENSTAKFVIISFVGAFTLLDIIVVLYSLFDCVIYKNNVIYHKFIITIKKSKKENIKKVIKKDENYIFYNNKGKKICVLNEYDKKTHQILNELSLPQSVFEIE